MKKNLLALVACGVLLVGLTGCGSNDSTDNGGNGGSSQALYKTMSIQELNSETDSNDQAYKNYLGKKIKITGLSVSDSKVMSGDKFVTVYVSCSNSSSLDMGEGDIVSVTGVVDETWTSFRSYSLNNCTIEK